MSGGGDLIFGGAKWHGTERSGVLTLGHFFFTSKIGNFLNFFLRARLVPQAAVNVVLGGL